MEAVKALLDKYNLIDPLVDDTPGVFSNGELQNLYFELVQEGSLSVSRAMYAGASIEDLDIFDLKEFIQAADNVDIRTVYQNLMKGSRNHLRAFVSHLHSMGEDYEATYLSSEEVEEIVDSPMERGMVDHQGNPFYPEVGW